jgi:peptidoglycan/LPS O-acetylase OafA/YrhL
VTGGRFAVGDPLRAVAALSVLVYHVALGVGIFRGAENTVPGGAFEPQGLAPAIEAATGHLDLGLYIFFVLSGYLIARPFVRAFVAGDPAPAVVPYARNRLLRILPAFWLVLTVLLVLNGTLGAPAREVLGTYAFAIAYIDTPLINLAAQSWTLLVELVYYLLLPLVALAATALLGRRAGAGARLALVAAGALGLGLASLAWLNERPPDFHEPPASMWPFVPGILLAAVEIELEPRLRGRAFWRWPAVALVAAGVALLALSTGLPGEHEVTRALLIAAGTGAVVAGPLLLQWSTGGTWRVLDNRVAHWLGERSYSIYLVHLGVIYMLRDLATGPDDPEAGFWLLLAVAVPVTIAAAAVSYRLFELPFLRRRARWRRRPAPAGSAP